MAKPLSTDPSVEEDLKELNRQVTETAEAIVFRTFPQKILQLHQLIESTKDASSPYHRSHMYNTTDAIVYPAPSSTASAPDTKKRKRGDSENESVNSGGGSDFSNAKHSGLVLANQHIRQVQDGVKRECEELIELCDQVKLWISLTMPKIEDGDNFGVQIQEEVLSELHRSQESGYNLRDEARTSYLNRAKICSKLIKYPNVEDYSFALREHDAKQLYMARQHLIDIKNIYSVLTDVIHKNIQKIRAPRGNNRASLY